MSKARLVITTVVVEGRSQHKVTQAGTSDQAWSLPKHPRQRRETEDAGEPVWRIR
jgi:hypothetical protein